MAYCPNCGSKTKRNSRYCDACGTSIKGKNNKNTYNASTGNYYTEKERYEPQDYCHDDINVNEKTFSAVHCAFGIIGVVLFWLPHLSFLLGLLIGISLNDIRYIYYFSFGLGMILMGVSLGAIYKYILHSRLSNIDVTLSSIFGVIICLFQFYTMLDYSFVSSISYIMWGIRVIFNVVINSFIFCFIGFNIYTVRKFINNFRGLSYMRRSAIVYFIALTLELMYLTFLTFTGNYFLLPYYYSVELSVMAIVQIIAGISFFMSVLRYSKEQSKDYIYYT